jgi:hypothetical protein
MLHKRIIGFGWLLLGILSFGAILYMTLEFLSAYLTYNNHVAAGFAADGFIGLLLSIAVMLVGLGVVRRRHWAVISCRVLSFLTVFFSLYFVAILSMSFSSKFRFDITIVAALSSVIAVVSFSVYSLIMLRHENAA